RLDSIFNQTFQDFEVILLDDASTDNSMDVLEKYAGRGDVQILRNEHNTGSPCKQWLKGIDLARSDILWIAESDDICACEFLQTLSDMRIAGDWYFIAHAIKGGTVRYEARKLNYHRRHSESVIGKTIQDKKIEDFFQEFYVVQKYIFNNYQLAPEFQEKWEKY